MMKHQEIVWALAFLSVITLSRAHVGGGHIGFHKVDPQVYCGRNLANILAKLCEGIEKRSDAETLYNTILSPYYKDQDAVWPWIAHNKARSRGFPSRGKRYQTDYGIVNECCENPCSENELLQYCY